VYDAYDPLGPLRRVLEGSWRLGRLFGIEIRVYWTAALVFLVGVFEFSRWPGVGWGEVLLLSALFQGGLYMLVLTHELAHAWAGRRYGVRTPRITLSALGGLAHMSDPPPTPRAEIAIAAAGPASHLPWIGLAWLLRDVVPPLRVGSFGLPIDGMSYLLWTNVALAAFNLLPCFPLDGGRVLRGTLALRRSPNWASLMVGRLGVFGGIAFLAVGMSRRGFDGTMLLLIGLTNLQASLREIRAARHGDGPYGPPADPWATDADAWKQSADAWKQSADARKRGADPEERPSRRGFGSILRRHDAPRPPADRRLPTPLVPTALSAADDDAELDRLLAKVGEVGLPSLSDVERATLQRISESRRARR